MPKDANTEMTPPESTPAIAASRTTRSMTSGRQPWVAPKLTFVEPRLTKHGPLTQITGFFGSFSPGSDL